MRDERVKSYSREARKVVRNISFTRCRVATIPRIFTVKKKRVKTAISVMYDWNPGVSPLISVSPFYETRIIPSIVSRRRPLKIRNPLRNFISLKRYFHQLFILERTVRSCTPLFPWNTLSHWNTDHRRKPSTPRFYLFRSSTLLLCLQNNRMVKRFGWKSKISPSLERLKRRHFFVKVFTMVGNMILVKISQDSS